LRIDVNGTIAVFNAATRPFFIADLAGTVPFHWVTRLT
jgi:hypothetical protein